MQNYIFLRLKILLLLSFCGIVFDNIYALANIDIETKEKICNFKEAVCPSNKCCSDLECKEQDISYKCCAIPTGYNRESFSDYIVTKEGWGCSNCPKCGKFKYLF